MKKSMAGAHISSKDLLFHNLMIFSLLAALFRRSVSDDATL
jgi:hypothetical protein